MADKTKEMNENISDQKEEPWLLETVKSLTIAIFLALIFRSFAFEPFYIPSGSMKSNLLVGDYVFVSKYSYGYSRYSFPLGLDVFDGRVFEEKPQRGDVVVFKLPSNTSINYIKRLIGLPGDKIKVINGVLYINNQAVPKEPAGKFIDRSESGDYKEIARYVETLPNGVSYYVLDEKRNGDADNTVEYTVPQGHYFFMGDNRDNSQDSRYLDAVGFVPEENLLGPAKYIFFSTTASLFNPISWFTGLRFDRLFSKVTYIEENE